MIYREARQRVLETARRGFREGLVAGTSGNYSLFIPGEGVMCITASQIPYDAMTEAEIVVLDLEGRVLDGKARPSSEWPMHAAIYAARSDDILAIAHTHSPYATAFAVLGEGIPLILIEMLVYLKGDIPVAPFALPGTRAVGDSVLATIGRRGGCLLANHGVVAVGADLEEAYTRAVYVEDADRIYALARSMGQPRVLDSEVVKKMLGEK